MVKIFQQQKWRITSDLTWKTRRIRGEKPWESIHYVKWYRKHLTWLKSFYRERVKRERERAREDGKKAMAPPP